MNLLGRHSLLETRVLDSKANAAGTQAMERMQGWREGPRGSWHHTLQSTPYSLRVYTFVSIRHGRPRNTGCESQVNMWDLWMCQLCAPTPKQTRSKHTGLMLNAGSLPHAFNASFTYYFKI